MPGVDSPPPLLLLPAHAVTEKDEARSVSARRTLLRRRRTLPMSRSAPAKVATEPPRSAGLAGECCAEAAVVVMETVAFTAVFAETISEDGTVH